MGVAETATGSRVPRTVLPIVTACAAGVVPALAGLGRLRGAVPDSPSPWGYALFLVVAVPLFLAGTALVAHLLERRGGATAAAGLDRAGLLLYPAMGLMVPLVSDPGILRTLQGVVFLLMVFLRGVWLLRAARPVMLEGEGSAAGGALAAATLVPLVLFLGVASWTVTTSSTVGDEPYYLMVAESIIKDGDLALDDQYRPEVFGRYFWRDRLAPQNMERTERGWRSKAYATLFAVLLAPSTLVDPRWGPVLTMVIVAALLARQLFILSRSFTGDAGSAFFAWAAVSFTVPLLGFSWQIYPETAAALTAALMIRGLLSPRARGTAGMMVLGCLLLAGLKMRYLPLGLALIAVYVIKAALGGNRKRGAWTLLVTAAGVGLVLAADRFLLDGALVSSRFSTPNLVFRSRKLLRFLPAALTGLAADQEFGLLVHSPLYLLLPAGIWWSLRRRSRAALLLLPPAAYLLVLVGHFGHLWYGGFSQPGRYLVVLLPFAAPLMAVAYREGKGILLGAITLLSAAWSLLVTVPYLLMPVFRYNRADGTNNVLEAAREKLGLPLADLLPSLTNAEAWGAGRLFWCWALVLAPAAAVVAWAALERKGGGKRGAPFRRVCGPALVLAVLVGAGAMLAYGRPTGLLEAEAMAQEGGTLYTGYGRGPVRVFRRGGWVEGSIVTAGGVSGTITAGVRGEGRPVLAVSVDGREAARVTLRGSPERYLRENYAFRLETPPGRHRLRILVEPSAEAPAAVYLDRISFDRLP